MQGQYTIDGLAPAKKRRPSAYPFSRYIGQRVRTNRGEHIIKAIEPYYTFFTDGMAGTPHDTMPADPEEWKQAMEVELEWNEYTLATSKDDLNRKMAARNVELIKAALKGGKTHGKCFEPRGT